MKRPIVTITLGYITGIIGGLYLHIVPFVFVVIIAGVVICKKRWKNIYRVLKLFATKKTLIVFCIASTIGAGYVIYLEIEYHHMYTSLDKGNVKGTIISDKKESRYYDIYQIRCDNMKLGTHQICPKRFLLQVKKLSKTKLQYGDTISFMGEYTAPEVQRNYGGFDYQKYLKTQNIAGTMRVKGSLKIVAHHQGGLILGAANAWKNYIQNKMKTILPEESLDIFYGIALGDRSLLSEEVKDEFANSSLSHLLAVSGMHIAYLIMGLTILLKRTKLPKQVVIISACGVLVFYLAMIGAPASATRAVVMAVIGMVALLVHRKQDTATTISVSCLVMLIVNPYQLFDIGFLRSFGGTIGIIAFMNAPRKEAKAEQETNALAAIKVKLQEAVRVTVAAQMLILPIMVYCFHSISLTFILSNVLAGIIIGPIVILGFVLMIVCLLPIPVWVPIAFLYRILISMLLTITQWMSHISISNLSTPRPPMWGIVFYYGIIFIFWIVKRMQRSERIYLKKHVQRLITTTKQCIIKHHRKMIGILLVSTVCLLIIRNVPGDLKLHFIDVGQGDSCLVVTPTHQTMLVDSGGNDNYDIGKNTLHPYLLNRGITTIDYIMISHFDTDHCKGFEYLLEHMKVKHILMSKQTTMSENYKKITSLAKANNIPMHTVRQGQVMKLDKYTKVEILSPKKGQNATDMNDTSIVARLTCYHTSIVFTGDASQEIETAMLKESKNKVRATILKVGHHGSKTSTSEAFLKAVNPKIALIGVGENNKFGHPTQEVLDKLQKNNIKVYRTDQMGEISVTANKQGEIKIHQQINNE